MRHTIRYSRGMVHFDVNGEQAEMVDCRDTNPVCTKLTIEEARSLYREMMAAAPVEAQYRADKFKVGDHVCVENLGLAVIKRVDRTLNGRGYELRYYHGKAAGTVGNEYFDHHYIRRI